MDMNPGESAISILLVEDDEVDIQNILREFSHLKIPIQFHIAKNGVEALDKLYGTNGTEKIAAPHAIILDTNMPKMNGIEFLETLRKDSNFDSVQVFILSGEYTTREKLAMHHLSVAFRIVKPLQLDDVRHLHWLIMRNKAK